MPTRDEGVEALVREDLAGQVGVRRDGVPVAGTVMGGIEAGPVLYLYGAADELEPCWAVRVSSKGDIAEALDA